MTSGQIGFGVAAYIPVITSAPVALSVRPMFFMEFCPFVVLWEGAPWGWVVGLPSARGYLQQRFVMITAQDGFTQRPGLFAVFSLVSRFSVLPNLNGLEDCRDDSDD